MIVEVLIVLATWTFVFGVMFTMVGDLPWALRCLGVAVVCGIEIEARTPAE